MPRMKVWPDSWSTDNPERRIFLRQPRSRATVASFLLVALGFGLHCHFDNRIGKLHALQNNRRIHLAQRVARGDILQARERNNIAGIRLPLMSSRELECISNIRPTRSFFPSPC